MSDTAREVTEPTRKVVTPELERRINATITLYDRFNERGQWSKESMASVVGWFADFGFEIEALRAALAAAPVVPAPSDAPRLARQGGLTEEMIEAVRMIEGGIEGWSADMQNNATSHVRYLWHGSYLKSVLNAVRRAFAPYLNPPAPTPDKEKTCRERIDEEINRHKLDDYTDVEISILSQVKILADYIDAMRREKVGKV